ncbi:hypothetical protein LSTR_LSTR006363 [Laodelphax striatellus]|uniref:Armadillo repeat-containing protein 4 n=1 Tax=Laodelphax striatellus TaxID=195883 RepID=A0A482XDQ4_LAOST|nr:hypothetical protein LSTR_LSTR006363 [Laodelphax striatellus]
MMEQILRERRKSDADHGDEKQQIYWHVRKLIKKMKPANQAETYSLLEKLVKYDFKNEKVRDAMKDSGGYNLLANILKCDDYSCNKATLDVLLKMTQIEVLQRLVIELGVISSLISYLERPIAELQATSALIISQIAELQRGRDEFQRKGGIERLFKLVDVPLAIVTKSENQMTVEEREQIDTLINCTKAFYQLSYSETVKEQLFKLGITKVIRNFLQAKNLQLVEYTMGLLQNCATDEVYQKAIVKEDIIRYVLKRLKSKNADVKELSARAIFRSCADAQARELVFKHNGIDYLVDLLDSPDDQKRLLAAITGAIWKCAKYDLKVLMRKNVFPKLIQLIIRPTQDEETEEIRVNTVGALAELCQLSENRRALILRGTEETMNTLKKSLKVVNTDLLVNTCAVIGECAQEKECVEDIVKNDFVRLIWSVLKNPSIEVQAKAAWALIPCIRNYDDAGELVRSYVGGFEVIIRLLDSSDLNVLGHTCAAISEIAKDKQNVAILTELGMLPKLSSIISKHTGYIMMYASLAIMQSCKWKNNSYDIGRMGTIVPLIAHLKRSKSLEEKAALIKAISALSDDDFNCITMHKCGIVPILLEASKIDMRDMQEDIAKCFSNIRRLALLVDGIKFRAKKYNYKKMKSTRYSMKTAAWL